MTRCGSGPQPTPRWSVTRHWGDWLATVRRSGSATRLAGGVEGLRALVDGSLDVLARLPTTEVLTLAGLAAEDR